LVNIQTPLSRYRRQNASPIPSMGGVSQINAALRLRRSDVTGTST
jgi:hypothetical protein